MKTNAKPETILKAIEAVNEKKYKGNIILRKEIEKLSKNMVRFTLKAIDAEGPGAMVAKNGLKQPKANQDVYEDVLYEIFRIQNQKNIFGDHALKGKIYNPNPDAQTDLIAIVTTPAPTVDHIVQEQPKRSQKTKSRKPVQAAKKTGSKKKLTPQVIIRNAIESILTDSKFIQKIERQLARK